MDFSHEVIAEIYEMTLTPERDAGLLQRIAGLCACEGVSWRRKSVIDCPPDEWVVVGDDSRIMLRVCEQAYDVIEYEVVRCQKINMPHVRRVLEFLHPHIVRADRIADALRLLELQRKMLETIARQRGLIILLFDRQKKLIAVMPDDLRLKPLSSVVTLDERGLHISDRKIEHRFDAALSNCIGIPFSSKPGVMDVMTLADENPQKTLRLIMLPWHEENATSSGNIAAVVMLGSVDIPWIDPKLIQSLFGLSRAEAAVAIAITQGHRCRTIANHLCVTEHTVRAHTKSILAKCGARSQADLVRMLLCCPAAYVPGPAGVAGPGQVGNPV